MTILTGSPRLSAQFTALATGVRAAVTPTTLRGSRGGHDRWMKSVYCCVSFRWFVASWLLGALALDDRGNLVPLPLGDLLQRVELPRHEGGLTTVKCEHLTSHPRRIR